MTNAHAVIIDDQQSNIDVLVMLLDQQGVTHTEITSVRDVLPTVSSAGKIDVIFLDLEMPNGHLFSTFSELKSTPGLAGVPIVAYTVHVSEIDRAREAGFDSFLGKPLQLSEFPEQLRKILNGEQVWSY
jgi:two-component system cell cycle response regulator DivK